jgi:hypothetical protein
MTPTTEQRALAAAFFAALDEPAPLREFVVTVQPDGVAAPVVTLVKARHAFDATTEAMASAPDGAKVDVRPLIGRTEFHGFDRWPEALHADATAEAYRGWLWAQQNPGKDWCVVQAEEAARVRERRALNLQMDAVGQGRMA